MRLAPRDREIGGAGGDGLAPARQRAVAAEGAEPAEDLEERVLDQILELAVGAEDPVERVVNAAALGVEQLALRRAITGRSPARQRQVELARRRDRTHPCCSGSRHQFGRTEFSVPDRPPD